MVWLRTWQLGVKSLLLHPMRSTLTVLGIFIGVASVIWLLAIGEGISREAQKQIEGLGADNIIIRSIKPPPEAVANVRGPLTYGLTRADLRRMEATVPTLKEAIPVREVRKEFRYASKLVDGRLVGCTPPYADVTRLEVERGRFLNQVDSDNLKNHCVLAAEVADRLFGFENPLGQSVRVEGDYYQVVGVLKPRAPTAAIGGSLAAQDFSSDIYVPYEVLWKRMSDVSVTRRSGTFEMEEVQLNQITLKVRNLADVLPTADLLKATLANHDRTRDISLVVPLELINQAQTTRFMFMVFMGLIAAISLVVGGIGIMNIMLATVTERTREIGIRRALGARRLDIVYQFLVETIVLSVLGGLTGIAGGLLCTPVVRGARALLALADANLLTDLPDVVRNMEPVVVWTSIPLAFGIAVTVGVLFGLYPAIRAAFMNPIEALRHA